MTDEARTASMVQSELATSQAELLERLAAEIRDGTLIVEGSEWGSDIVPLPPLPEDLFVVSCDTGMMTFTITVRAPEKQRKYAEKLLERL